jgi:HEPN domain-containing protein
MTKQEIIQYWKETADKDWIAVQSLFNTKNYVHSLFFAHLSLEKLCKAHWVNDNTELNAPRGHNLVYLLKQTQLDLSVKDEDFLNSFNDFQLEGRYPDYKQNIFKICTLSYTKKLLSEVEKIRQWLISNLP